MRLGCLIPAIWLRSDPACGFLFQESLFEEVLEIEELAFCVCDPAGGAACEVACFGDNLLSTFRSIPRAIRRKEKPQGELAAPADCKIHDLTVIWLLCGSASC